MVINITDSSIDKLHAFVEQHLPPKKIERKMFGEVFTPLSLVDEMLTAVEKYGDKNIWNNPKLKILDPAAGIGNFPLIAYQKLMKGLKHIPKYKDEECRRKHILENMLYMIELNPTNARLMKKIFGGRKYKLNIVKGDALDNKTHKQLLSLTGEKELKFDIIMGNPPYNDDKGIAGGGNNLYQKFVGFGLNHLTPNGVLTMITPAGILKTTDYEEETFFMTAVKNMTISYININECEKHFPNIGSNFVYYVISNKKSHFIKASTSKVKTVIVNSKNINIKDLRWIPIIASNTCINIIKKCSLHTFNFKRNDSMTDFNRKVFMKRLNHLNYNNPSMFPKHDFDNKNRNTGVMLYHDVNSIKEAEFMCSILDSNLFKFINIVSRFDAVIYHKLLNQFGIPKTNTSKRLRSADVYELYGLTMEEIKLIESVISS